MYESPSVQVAKQTISELLDGLSPQNLRSVEDFVRFLRQQEAPVRGRRYPTVENPPSSLNAWVALATEGYDGDALADTEALYDEV